MGDRRAGEPDVAGDEAEEARLKRVRLQLIGLGLQLGATTVGAFAIFLGGGILLDRRLGTKPLFLFVGLLLAFIAIGYNLYEIAILGATPRGVARPKASSAAGKTATKRASAWDDEEERDEDDWPVRRGPGSGGRRRDDGAGDSDSPSD